MAAVDAVPPDVELTRQAADIGVLPAAARSALLLDRD